MSINIINEPSIFLVGRSEVNDAELDRFLSENDVAAWSTDSSVGGEKLAEIAGRCCYWSFAKPRPGGNKSYIGHILDVAHGSVLEHATFNFIITGVSRSLTHEMVRHRAGFGFSQLSQRYVDESDTAFVVPPALAEEVIAARRLIERFSEPYPKARDVLDWGNRHLGIEGMHQLTVEEGAGLRWLAGMEQTQRDYLYLSDYLSSKGGIGPISTDRRKAAREAARSVLPNSTETKIFISVNARAARHFIELRGNAAADAEIRRLAHAMLGILQVEAPNIFGDMRIEDGSVVTANHKV